MLVYDLSKGRGVDLNQLVGYLTQGLNVVYAPSTVFRGVSSIRCGTLTYSHSENKDEYVCDSIKITVEKKDNNYEIVINDVAKVITSSVKYGFITLPTGMYELFLVR